MLLFIGGFATCVVCIGVLSVYGEYEYNKENARKMYAYEHGHYPDW